MALCISVTAFGQTTPRLWLIGDSTVNNNINGGVGWGNVVQSEFTIDVVNRAVGGRSARSFYPEYDYRINQFPTNFGGPLNPGDYLIMQFGHNGGIGNVGASYLNELAGIGEETASGTDKNGNPETVHTFGWYLRQMVAETRANGGIPIIASRVPRAGDTNPDASEFVASKAFWAQQVAEQENVGFLDLYNDVTNEYSAQRVQGLDIRNTYFGPDATHTNTAGAELNAEFVATGVGSLTGEAGTLKQYLVNPPSTVPEPSSTLLLAAGSAWLCSRRRRS